MLILYRRAGQSITIGNDIKIRILSDINGVRVGIDAPKEIKILRDELIKHTPSTNPFLIPSRNSHDSTTD